MIDGPSVGWMLAAANVLLVGPLVFLLVQAFRRERAELIRTEADTRRMQENEHRLRSILEAEPQGILVLGHDRRMLQINPAGCLLFDAGFSEEMLGKDVREFVHVNDRQQFDDMHSTAQEGRETYGKCRLVGLSKQVRWVEITSVPLPAADGAVPSVLSVVRDVTEQKRADRRQALQHAVAKVLASSSTLEQAVPDLLQAIVVSLDWQVGLFWRVQDDRRTITCTQDWSVDPTMVPECLRRSEQETHTSGSDLPGRCWASGEPLWVEDITQDSIFTRELVTGAGMVHAACAFPIWLRANVYGVMEFFSREPQAEDWELLKALGTAGSQIGLFVERTEVEVALHENEARTSLIIDTALDAVITMDQTGHITEWNARAEDIFGWSAFEVIGRDAADTIFPPSHCRRYLDYVQRLHESRETSSPNMPVEMIALRRDGREFPVEIAMTPLAVEGAIIFSAFIRDITKRKEAEQSLKDYAQQLECVNQQLDAALKEAKAATEAKSSFLATMSHEIRTPMNGVIGMTGLLLDTTLTEEQREYTESIRTCGDHLLTIINDILDFSKIEAGKLDLDIIEFDLRLAVDESIEFVAERASAKGLNLACLFHADVPRRLLGDPGRLRQIVMNLTANAIKFTDSGDVLVEVTVEAQSEEEATVRIAVTDTGIGIPDEARERLFQSFSQADGSTTRKYGGTGLGLAICKRLVELMRGTISVTSQVGEGSCFWFTVNLRKQADNSSRGDTSAVVLANLHVLIVSDKPVNRKILEPMIKRWDMRPTFANSEAEALETLHHRHGRPSFDIVLVDVDKEPSDGIALARAIRARTEGVDTQVVLLTASGRRGDAKAAREAGISAYLTKPIRERQLHDCLVTAMIRRPLSSEVPATIQPLITRHTLAETKARADLRILLAEDNIINQKVAVRLFQRLGYPIDVVTNGREAVEALTRTRYDVVFMDCQMPEMDGFEATRLIREREASGSALSIEFRVSSPKSEHSGGQSETSNQKLETLRRLSIIAMTANAMRGDRERCLDAGMDDYLSKPISVDALRGILDRLSNKGQGSQPDTTQEAA